MVANRAPEMTPETPAAPAATSMAGAVVRRPLKRSEYHRLIDAGVFVDEKIELLFGELVEMNPQKRPHSATSYRFHTALAQALVGRAGVMCHLPIVGALESEPEPDVAVFDPADEDDEDEHPTHVWLVVEVADSSRAKDLGPKARLYALTGIPEYWVVDLQKRVVRVMREPADGEYRLVTTLPFYTGATLSPARFPDVVLHVDALVPKAAPAAPEEDSP